jgi:glycerate kinase
MNELHSIDIQAVHPLLKQASITVLCDVRNTICGPEGAAVVYGPQKGASADGVMQLNDSLFHLVDKLEAVTGKAILELPSGGTAGGAAAGLYAVLNATLVPGIDYFLDLTNFNDSLAKADVVITGEGRLDEQTMQGKAPFGVGSRAKAAGKTTMCIAGSIPDDPSEAMCSLFDYMIATSTSKYNIREGAFTNLTETATQAAKQLFQ